MFAFKTLQRRLIFLLVVPLILFLLGFGVFGYRFIQGLLFKEWGEVAILKLERAAHQMDMKLHEQKEWMESFARAGQDSQGEDIQRWLLKQEQAQPGVHQVNLTWKQAAVSPGSPGTRNRSAILSAIGFSYPSDGKTVGLQADLLDDAGRPVGHLEVLLSYDYLMQETIKEGWLVAQMACLVSAEGRYLAHSNPAMQGRHCLGETQNPLELAMLKDIQKKPSGTLMSEGYIPQHVIGYYKLHTAPWAIMLHAQGSQILAPILRFRFYYLLGGILCLAVILVLIRLEVKPVVTAIQQVATKAAKVARGQYGEPGAGDQPRRDRPIDLEFQ